MSQETSREKVVAIREKWVVQLPGTWQTLAILVAFFGVKYAFGFLEATQPALAVEYFWFDLGASGLFSGYFLGKALAYLKKFL